MTYKDEDIEEIRTMMNDLQDPWWYRQKIELLLDAVRGWEESAEAVKRFMGFCVECNIKMSKMDRDKPHVDLCVPCRLIRG